MKKYIYYLRYHFDESGEKIYDSVYLPRDWTSNAEIIRKGKHEIHGYGNTLYLYETLLIRLGDEEKVAEITAKLSEYPDAYGRKHVSNEAVINLYDLEEYLKLEECSMGRKRCIKKLFPTETSGGSLFKYLRRVLGYGL